MKAWPIDQSTQRGPDQRGLDRRTGSNLFAIEKTSRRRPIAGKIFNWYFIL